MRGRHNFDRVRYVYFRDRLPAFESFKKGETTFREEFTSRIWASDYTFPAVTEGRVIRDETPDASLSAGQAWFFNTRRAKFADPIVREALTNAFDFEWTNQNLMFGSYARSASYFENSALKASGKPEGAELALLEPFRDQLPARVFDADATVPPVSDGTGSDRVLLGVASDLLARAGCMLSGATLLTPAGEPFTIEFLSNTQVFEPHHNRYIINLARLGIEASYRLVDGAQYEERMNDFDFDMTVSRANTALYPSVSLRQAFSSQAASQPGSRNYAGIADPAVDALVEAAVGSRQWDAFVTATRALDRVLRARHYTVPQWYKGTHWLAFWDVFGRPPPMPLFERAAVDTWWYDSGKAARIDKT
jgi:microcin C transport system substrate-binding protein